MKSQSPPPWVDFIIDGLAPAQLAEEIEGDLYEQFTKDIPTRGLRSARRRYAINGLGFLARRFFWKKSSSYNTFIMLRSNFKMARRSLMAYKGTTAINIFGLVIGIASALVILNVVMFEWSFDKFHSNTDHIYRMVRVSGDDMSEFRTGISYPVPAAVEKETTFAENITAMEYFGGANVEILDKAGTTERKFREEEGFAFVEPRFFDVLDYKGTDFKWINGEPEKALAEPNSIVLTRSMAKKYFGDENPVGETIKLQRWIDCIVTGVVEDFPANTDYPFTVLISYSTIRSLAGDQRMNDWMGVNDSHHTLVVLKPGVTQQEAEAQIATTHAAHTDKELSGSRHYLLQKLTDVHYDARFGTFSGRIISKQTILGLCIVALFLVLTGSINYINLATAQSTLRAKEIGLRKVMGSNRTNLVTQYLTETFVIVFLAGVIALGLSEVLLISLEDIVDIPHTRFQFSDPLILLLLVTIITVVTLLAGLYPSLVLSRFNAVTALKNKFATEKFGGFSLRKVLVVLQFTITQMLVVGTYIVVSQMEYFRDVDMGFNKEGIINARIPVRDPNVLKVMEDKLRAQAVVSDVSFSYTLPSGVRRNHHYADIGRPEASTMKDYHVYEYVSIDSSYIGLYNIKLLAGRNLTINDTVGNIIINKTLMGKMEFANADDAIGKKLKMGDATPVTVVGVIDDYFSNSMKEPVDNIALVMQPENYSIVSIKLNVKDGSGSLPDAVKLVEKIWSETFPDFMFSYTFMDENIAEFYKQEQKYADLFQLFSLIFLLIGSLGLYGLITFVVNRKGKEVAIRKVLGATIGNIIVMFSSEYLALILISFVLAVPVAYYAVNSWLSNFTNHVDLAWYLFFVPGLLVIFIALVVISAKSLRAATANPVDKLRCE